MKEQLQIENTPESWKVLQQLIEGLGEGSFTVTVTNAKTRTGKQQACIEVYCRQVAERLADAGFDFRQAVTLPIVPTQALVKDQIWRAIQTAILPGKTSTTQLETDEVSQVYERMNLATADRFKFSVPFPSIESLSRRSM